MSNASATTVPMKVAEALKNMKPTDAVVDKSTFDEKNDFKNSSSEIKQWHDCKYTTIAQ